MVKSVLAIALLSINIIAHAGAFGALGTIDVSKTMAEQQQRQAEIQLLQMQAQMIQTWIACREAGGGDKCGPPPQIQIQGKITDYACVQGRMTMITVGQSEMQKFAQALNDCTR